MLQRQGWEQWLSFIQIDSSFFSAQPEESVVPSLTSFFAFQYLRANGSWFFIFLFFFGFASVWHHGVDSDSMWKAFICHFFSSTISSRINASMHSDSNAVMAELHIFLFRYSHRAVRG